MAKPDFSKLLSEQMAKATGAAKARETETPFPGKEAAPPHPQVEEETQPVLASTNPAGQGTIPAGFPERESPASTQPPPPPPLRTLPPGAAGAGRASNLNRVTVNLFDADRRALAVIKEKLANSGHDFTNRSDSIKIGLRIAAKASKEELSALILEVRSEDRRFSGRENG